MDAGYFLLRTVPDTEQTNILKTSDVAHCLVNIQHKTKQMTTRIRENPVTYINIHVFFHN